MQIEKQIDVHGNLLLIYYLQSALFFLLHYNNLLFKIIPGGLHLSSSPMISCDKSLAGILTNKLYLFLVFSIFTELHSLSHPFLSLRYESLHCSYLFSPSYCQCGGSCIICGRVARNNYRFVGYFH